MKFFEAVPGELFFHLWPRPTAHYTQMLWMCCTPHTVKT